MTRSSLTTKYTLHTVSEFENKFKEQYKRENDEKFKGNVIDAITLGVIRKKRLPEVSDVLTLIKLGNIQINEEQAEALLTRWLDDENNRKRGLTGAFCDCCKDLTIDIPLNQQFVNSIMSLEDNIQKQGESMNKINDLMNKLTSLGDKLKDSIKDSDTTDDSEQSTDTSEQSTDSSEQSTDNVVSITKEG